MDSILFYNSLLADQDVLEKRVPDILNPTD